MKWEGSEVWSEKGNTTLNGRRSDERNGRGSDNMKYKDKIERVEREVMN